MSSLSYYLHITQEELKIIEEEAIVDLIAKQKQAGYSVITDGEFRRSYCHLVFMWGFNGIQKVELNHGYFFHGEETTKGSIAINTAKFYPDMEELIQDIAKAYRTTIQELYDVGCRNLQLDDGTWGMFCDQKY